MFLQFFRNKICKLLQITMLNNEKLEIYISIILGIYYTRICRC